MIPYLLHVSILLTGFYLLYRFLLSGETFYQLNRWVLMGCLIGAFLLPMIEIPTDWSLGNELYTSSWEDQKAEDPERSDWLQTSDFEQKGATLTAKHAGERILSAQAIEVQEGAVVPASPISGLAPPPPPPVPEDSFSSHEPSAWHAFLYAVPALLWIYVGGICWFGIRWLIQLCSLISLIRAFPRIKDRAIRIIHVSKDIAPFSFLNVIVINPDPYSANTYQQILKHEKIHVLQWHSLDMILVELLVIVLWFLPFAWRYRQAVKHNLEFLVDASMLRQGTSRESYQWNLLKVAAPSASSILVTNYSQSFLKQRITMMNAPQSTQLARWKYSFLLLFIGSSIVSLNAVIPDTPLMDSFSPNLNIQETEQPLSTDPPSLEQAAEDTQGAAAMTPSSASPSVQDQVAENAPLPASEDLTPTLQLLAEEESTPTPDEAHPPQATPEVSAEIAGVWTATIKADKICLTVSDDSFWEDWQLGNCFKREAFTALPLNRNGEFYLRNELGELAFNGSFDQDKGRGSFRFHPNPAFNREMQRVAGISFSEEELFRFFMTEIDQQTNTYLLLNRYASFSKEQLLEVVEHGQGFEASRLIENLDQANYAAFTAAQLLEACLHGQAHELGTLVNTLHPISSPRFSAEQLLQACLHGQAHELGTLVNTLHPISIPRFSAEQLLQACLHGQAHELRKLTETIHSLNYAQFSSEQLLEACMHGQAYELGYLVERLHTVRNINFNSEQLLKACMHGQGRELGNLVDKLQQYVYIQFDSEDLLQACMHGQANEMGYLVSILEEADYTEFSSSEILEACNKGQAREIAKLVNILKAENYTPFSSDQITQAAFFGHANELGNMVQALSKTDYIYFDAEHLLQICIYGKSREAINMVLALQELDFIPFTQREVYAACMYNNDRKAVKLVEALKDAGNTSYDAKQIVDICFDGQDGEIKRKLSQDQAY
ncbi:MAG: M56 family metallopeptidase [Bacteroidota bacterium]